ncbi:outer membrane protein assembly factor BamE [Gilliamella sp. B2776]|uniref:hypothetical protein n=1 Tax=unclassified Gilliamella TaxID=2685620 RepID=UPI00226A60C6|nr:MULTISPECIES: hypothetical protein [unclassified Gilliamella]MCX8649376.1 outer membrane protein assembly factor BamE [Gilliamella sp. B2779]MCX8654763.1 outer membrane protein assembly factor BamE [Gilliamella sp. B2737]MCX8655783.1 outer membrane protein assembly factor BamE [Gilliamella sp. B2894]MCX8663886.1 outer membrane protein assembly factor BamE [Gilliamella sp. B2887]MCX8691129.1 outer membrane protein assembly factor BamE [Gilliamella sp. B2776]
MKNVNKFFIALFSIILLSGCTQNNFIEQGTPLSKDKVSSIVEGSTTEAQIISLFGEPASKKVINSDEVQWTYKYIRKSSTSHLIIGETQSNAISGTLDVIISKGVVTWYNYDENHEHKRW